MIFKSQTLKDLLKNPCNFGCSPCPSRLHHLLNWMKDPAAALTHRPWYISLGLSKAEGSHFGWNCCCQRFSDSLLTATLQTARASRSFEQTWESLCSTEAYQAAKPWLWGWLGSRWLQPALPPTRRAWCDRHSLDFHPGFKLLYFLGEGSARLSLLGPPDSLLAGLRGGQV